MHSECEMTCRAGLHVCKENGVRRFEPSPDHCGLPIAQNCETQSRGLTVVVCSPHEWPLKKKSFQSRSGIFFCWSWSGWGWSLLLPLPYSHEYIRNAIWKRKLRQSFNVFSSAFVLLCEVHHEEDQSWLSPDTQKKMEHRHHSYTCCQMFWWRKSLLLSPSYWPGIRVNRPLCLSILLWDKWRRGWEAMNSLITFSWGKW